MDFQRLAKADTPIKARKSPERTNRQNFRADPEIPPARPGIGPGVVI